jgi:steroid 5-alpha reductase family enzyme
MDLPALAIDLPTLFVYSAVAILGVMLVLWLISLRVEDASIADTAWGPLFVLVAVIGVVFGGGWGGRKLLVIALVGLWGLRLGWHVFNRNRGEGEDPRYAKWREQHGQRWWWLSLFQVFLLQGAILWIVSLPIQFATGLTGAEHYTVWDAVGELVWAVGFLMETISDAQLRAFKNDPERSGVLDTGLWRFSRHPNYFGDALLWWGIWLIALSVPWGWVTFPAPILMTLLLRYVSGVPLAERMMEGRPGWDAYVRRTPIFVPGPRRRA